jgi:hypothetical protein
MLTELGSMIEDLKDATHKGISKIVRHYFGGAEGRSSSVEPVESLPERCGWSEFVVLKRPLYFAA